MELSEALEVWGGELNPSPHFYRLKKQAPDQRVLYLGAGFTKATNSSAPLFGQYSSMVMEQLCQLPTFPEALREAFREKSFDGAAITELAELYHNYAGRRKLAELFMTEPVGQDHYSLAPGAYQDWLQPLPPRGEATYRSLEHWQALVDRHQPLHLSVLNPGAPPHMVGRLLWEGSIQQVLSTNWDSYVELGAWLTGLVVERAGKAHLETRNRQTLQVFDRGRSVSLFTRHRQPLLLKLHSGIDVVCELLDQVGRGWLTQEQAEQQLRSYFLVSSTDLTHWRDATQWVQDVVSDALRASRVLFVGVSGADPVTFRAVRARVQEWELAARDWTTEQAHVPRLHRDAEPETLPLVALARGQLAKNLRLACMMSIQPPRGSSDIHVATSDGHFGLRGAYAWSLLRQMLQRLELDDPLHQKLAVELEQRLKAELNGGNSCPLLSLLCDALGPNARWAALAEGRTPFDAIPTEAAARWWYAPWFYERSEAVPVSTKAIQQLVACAAWLSRQHPLRAEAADDAPRSIQVDAWTGVVQVPEWQVLEGKEPSSPLQDLLSGRDLLLLSWPWKPREGVSAHALRWGLKHSLHWQVGRSLSWLASPRLVLLPVGDPQEAALSLPGRPLPGRPLPGGGRVEPPSADDAEKNRAARRRELPLAAGFAPLMDPIDWLELYRLTA